MALHSTTINAPGQTIDFAVYQAAKQLYDEGAEINSKLDSFVGSNGVTVNIYQATLEDSKKRVMASIAHHPPSFYVEFEEA